MSDASPPTPEPIHGSTLWELVTARAGSTPDAPMILDDLGRKITFGDFRARAERVAAGLSQLGVGEGTVVSWQLPTRLEAVVLSMALSRLGAVQNPIIHLYREREVASLLRTTGASWYIHPGVWKQFDYGAMGESISSRQTDLAPVALLEVYDSLPDGDPSALPPPPKDPDSVRWLYATSGTTSEPKAVRHSDATLIAGGIGITEALRPGPGDRNAVPFPYAHIGGPDNLVMTLRSGMAMVLVESFVPAESFAFFDRVGATHLGGSTAHYLALLAEQVRLGGRSPVSTMHTMCGGGAPKPPEVFWRVKEQTGVTVRHGYGMTECPMIACGAMGDNDEQLANSDGAPVLGCEVLIVDRDEQPVAAGTDGDILVRGPMLAKGYIDPVQTAESFRADGFFRTGDRGHLRTDGHIVLTGRSKELIIRKGENISPREIEDVLMTHVSVAAIAVIGLPDPERGERVCAVVETAMGKRALTFAEMAAHCRDAGLMTQKIPEQLEIVDALPRNPTMKILKRVLVEQLAATPPPDATNRKGTGMTNLFKDYLDSWATNDVDTVVSFFTDDIVYEDTTINHGATGMKQLRRFIQASFTNVPHASFDYINHVSDGTSYAVEWIMQPMNVRGVSIGTLRDGKIATNRDYWNGAAYKVPNT